MDEGTRYLRIKTISSVKFSAAPSASRPHHVNICGGSCCVDILTRCSHQLARAQTLLMMPGAWAGVMIMKRSPAALKQPRNWGKLSEDGLFMMGYLHNCNAEVENIYVHARCKPFLLEMTKPADARC